MKLIYIANARMPTEKAHGIQIMKMCEAFSKSKVPSTLRFRRTGASQKSKVELLVPWRFNHIKKDTFDYYGIKKNFRIKKLPCVDLIPLDFILKNLAFWIQAISFLIFAKIYLLFKKYDILYTREQFTGLFFKNFVLEIHSLSKRIKPFHKKIWKRAKKLIVLTSFIKKGLTEVGISGNKILVASDGVDMDKFDIEISKKEARQKLRLPQDKKLIGYVGMLRTVGMEKGIDVLIKSLNFFDGEVELVIVGGSRADIKLYKDLVKKLGLSDKILFMGKVGHSVIPIYLKSFDVLAAPFPKNKHYEFYMSPLKIFEYMAAKRLIVASDLPSIREILNEKNAVLVKPDDPEKLAESIQRILQNQDLADKISNEAFQDVQNYTWSKRAKRILNFITKV